MSGGHFDYNCFRISQFADELEREIEVNDSDEKDEYGSFIGRHYSQGTINRLKMSHEIIITAAKLAREIEWLYSGDHGEESFCRLVDKIMQDAMADK